MKKSKIQIEVELDEDSIPEKIIWDADEKSPPGFQETKSLSLSLWDHENKNTMRIDLWSKNMPVHEMKKFYLDCIGGIAGSIKNATGDQFMNQKIERLCDELMEYLQKDNP